MSREMREQLERALEAEHEDVFAIDGLLDLNDLMEIGKIPGYKELRDPPWTPLTQPRAAGARVRGPERDGGDARGRHPPAPPLRLVLELGRAARRGGRQRPRRARDQADRVPHERRLAARPGADPRRRARQAGGLPGGAQGPLRRAREHHLGEGDGGGRRARRLRPAVAQDARQVHPDRPPRGRRRAQLRPRRHRQLPPEDGAPLHGLRAAHLRRPHRRRRRRHVQLPHRLRAPAALPPGAGRARPPARRDPRRDRAHDRGEAARASTRASR